MAGFEYKVIPAPHKGEKAKGIKTPEARFSHSLEQLMNSLGAEGWEYQRADTLPSSERSGLTGSQTVWRHILVFRRPLTQALPHVGEPAVTPSVDAPVKAEHGHAPTADLRSDAEAQQATEPQPEAARTTHEDAVTDTDYPAGQPGATQMQRDNGVEETSEVSGPSKSLNSLAKSRKSPFGSNT